VAPLFIRGHSFLRHFAGCLGLWDPSAEHKNVAREDF